MKITSVILNTRFETPLWSISEYDTETKKKTHISIPEHIATSIVDFEKGSKDIKPDVYAFRLKSKALDKNFQD